MTTVSVTNFREKIADLGNRAAYAGERISVESHHKPFFAVVPIEDLQLLEYLEDKMDLAMAREALKRNDFVPWEDAKKELD
jgi:antitoxin (DNA-binding transcriptional repressor) of toxin-antitoxin stability system